MSRLSDIGPYTVVPGWLVDAGATPQAIALYVVLGLYANKDGVCWPSRRLLSERLGCSESTLDRAKAELIRLAALESSPQYSEQGDRTSNSYRLMFSAPDTESPMTRGGVTGEATVGSNLRQEPIPKGTFPLSGGTELALVPPEVGEAPIQGRLMGGFVEDWRAVHGRDPARRLRNAAGAAVKAALKDGEDPDDIAICLGVIAREGKVPNITNLTLVLADKHAGRPRRKQA